MPNLQHQVLEGEAADDFLKDPNLYQMFGGMRVGDRRVQVRGQGSNVRTL